MRIRPAPETAPKPWLRAAAFGIVSATIGCSGHAMAAGVGTTWSVFAVAAVLLTLLARVLVRGRVPAYALLAALAATQLVVHVACGVFSSDGAVARAAVATQGGMHAHGHHHAGMVMDQAAQGSSVHGHMPTALMLAVHVAALLVGFVVLCSLEGAIWRGVQRVVHLVVDGVRSLVPGRRSTASAAAGAVQLATRAPRRTCGRTRWATVAAGRRGPPVPAF